MDRDALASAGFELDAAEHARLAAFVRLLLAANERINLTATRDEAAFWGQHVCDSLALLPLIQEATPRTLADIGTGGGLPGLPLACVCPELHVTLVDARQKKLAVLDEIIAALGLANVTSCWGRAEDLAYDPAHREHYDVATARAVGDLRTTIEYASGLLKPAGQAWFFRSVHQLEDDLARAEKAAGRCRLSLIETRTYRLPEPHGERAVAVYHKDRPLPPSLPRRQGRPKSDPL